MVQEGGGGGSHVLPVPVEGPPEVGHRSPPPEDCGGTIIRTINSRKIVDHYNSEEKNTYIVIVLVFGIPSMCIINTSFPFHLSEIFERNTG